jgi:hypothetical protein
VRLKVHSEQALVQVENARVLLEEHRRQQGAKGSEVDRASGFFEWCHLSQTAVCCIGVPSPAQPASNRPKRMQYVLRAIPTWSPYAGNDMLDPWCAITAKCSALVCSRLHWSTLMPTPP